MDNIKIINEALTKIDGVEPLLTFSEPMTENNHKMVEGLAKAFADEGYRMYLEAEYSRALKMAALQGNDIHGIMFIRGRLSIIKELLSKGMNSFKNFNKI